MVMIIVALEGLVCRNSLTQIIRDRMMSTGDFNDLTL